MKCNEFRERLDEVTAGQNASGWSEAIKAHIETCADCRAQWEQHHRYLSLIASVGSVDPPRDLVASIRRQVTATTLRSPIPCTDVRRLLVGFVDDILDAEARNRVIEHTALCDACHSELNQLTLQKELLQALPPVPVPAGLKEQILSRVHAPRAVWTWPSLEWLRLRPRWAWGTLAIAVATVLLVLSGKKRPVEIEQTANIRETKVAKMMPPAKIRLAPRTVQVHRGNEAVVLHAPIRLASKRPSTISAASAAIVASHPQAPQTKARVRMASTNTPSSGSKEASAKMEREEKPSPSPEAAAVHDSADTILARAQSGRSEQEDDWEWVEFTEHDTTIPATPLDTAKPASAVHTTPVAAKPAAESKPAQRIAVLNIAAPSAEARPLAELRSALVEKRRKKEYLITEDSKIPSKMLSVNVFKLKFD